MHRDSSACSQERINEINRILESGAIITSIVNSTDGYYLTGSRSGENYRLTVIKLNQSLEFVWEKTFGSEGSDFEGHSATPMDDGLLICGGSHGHATESGGHGWKAYVLRLDASGGTVWERELTLRGNECAYHILRDSQIVLFGETKAEDNSSGFFLQSLDIEGKPLWHKTYGEHQNIIAGGLVPSHRGFIFAGNTLAGDAWQTWLCKVCADGKLEWEKTMPGYFVFQMCKFREGFLMTGVKSGRRFLAMMDDSGNVTWKSEFGEGAGISLLPIGDTVFVGGNDGCGNATVHHIDSKGNLLNEIHFEKEGAIEAIAEHKDIIIAARHVWESEEMTVLEIVNKYD